MYASFDTVDYQMAHGKQPRGQGNWALVPADYNYGDTPPYDGIFWHYGYWSAAKQEAERAYPRVVRWKVLT